jgi:hypothetical protein
VRTRCRRRWARPGPGRGYACLVLYLAREDEPERHRGAVVSLRDTVFAPPADALRFVRLDAPDVELSLDGEWVLAADG